ncbi:MAG: mannosyltransferase family protein [Actinomycetota bacterium]
MAVTARAGAAATRIRGLFARAGGGGSSPWEGIRYCLLVFLGMRVALGVLAVVALGTLPHPAASVGVPGWPAPAFTPGPHNFVTGWERADALWYLRIADGGYSATDGSAAFFPLYPLAVRGLSWVLGGHPLAAGLLVANVALLAGLVLLYRLTEREFSTAVARTAVLVVVLFPASFFFLAPFSEALFLLLAVASFSAARRRRWAWAGAFGALAALTRSVGVALAPALMAEAVHQFLEARHGAVVGLGDGLRALDGDGRGTPSAHIALPAAGGVDASTRRLAGRMALATLPVVGLVSYLAYWGARTGDWLAPYHAQVQWQRTAQLPWVTVGHATQQAFAGLGTFPDTYHLLDWLVVIPCLAAAGYAAWRFRPAYGIFTWGCLLPPLSYIFAPRAFMSDPRFLAPLFPVFWAVAVLVERGRLPRTAVLALSAAGLAIMTSLFVARYYVF